MKSAQFFLPHIKGKLSAIGRAGGIPHGMALDHDAAAAGSFLSRVQLHRQQRFFLLAFFCCVRIRFPVFATAKGCRYEAAVNPETPY
ncbi:hypothetical protein ACR6A7_17110 [Pantoea sp. RRHST58]|uniref:hypothetical protein n=1 Tax=Pantoea sp. RRHST58 TaxID=3425183 RepID=UPI002881729A|nr:hypothetical protein [Enterobacter sp. BRE11]